MPKQPRRAGGSRFARRLMFAFAAVAIAAAALTAILVNVTFGQRFESYLGDQQHAREQQVIALLAANYRSAGGWEPTALDRLAPALMMSGTVAEIDAPDGHRIWTASQSNTDPMMNQPHEPMMGSAALGPLTRLPVVITGRSVGTAVLQVPQATLPAVDRQFRGSVNWALLGGALTAGTLAVLLGWALARRTTRGVAELTAAADALAAGQRDRRAAVAGTDEIGDLAASFNAMADAVAREDQLRRSFASDVAHELRTPLTILRSQLEAIQDGIAAPSVPVVASMHEETLRLGRLVADLETIADAGAAGFSLDQQHVPLAPLIGQVVDGFAGHLAERNLTLQTALTETSVVADPVRIRQILTNLLTNAAKFTPSGGVITVTLRPHGESAELTVSDTGVGIPAEELPHIFERFYQGADARGAGSGIGLAVIDELVTAHAGDVSVQSQAGRGTQFAVRLPLAGAARGAHSSDPHTPALASVLTDPANHRE